MFERLTRRTVAQDAPAQMTGPTPDPEDMAVPEPAPVLPALFDPVWYAAQAAAQGVPAPEDAARPDLLADARLHADSRARGAASPSPCPLFSPAWYCARYPDVAVAGWEPLEHWLAHGARENRDPCALFSTAAYRAATPDLGEADPLAHWLAEGRVEGARPHPLIDPFDPQAPDLAIVIAFEGDLAALDMVLWSLREAMPPFAVTVYLVDDGRQPMRAALDTLAARAATPALCIRRLCQPEGAGLAPLFNAGLWAARQAGTHSHLALHDQATLIAPGLISGLIDLWAPVAAPVLNCAASAQCVPIDFDIYGAAPPLEALCASAGRRRAMIPGSVQIADRLSPGFVLLQASVIDATGLLDEAQALTAAGCIDALLVQAARRSLAPPVIARHLYAHRLEHSPVVCGAVPEVVSQRREGALPPGLVPDPALATAFAASAAADRLGLAHWTASAPHLFAAHDARLASVTRALARDLETGRRRPAGTDDPAHADGGDVEICFGDTPAPPLRHDPDGYRAAYRSLLSAAQTALVEAERIDFATLRGLQPLIAALARLLWQGPPVLVLTMDCDPVRADERDGYAQRVLAIDRALAVRPRIYLRFVQARRDKPALVPLEPGLWRLEMAHDDTIGAVTLAALLASGLCIYSHSLVGIDPPVLRRLLPGRTGPLLIDMHGAVPEEFVLYENHYMAQKYVRHEAWASRHADIVVCVTEAMADHFAGKLSLPRSRMLVCPIYGAPRRGDGADRPYNARPRAIYAGGTQRWQMIPEMAELLAETVADCDWILLTPDVEGMTRALARHGVSPDRRTVSVRAAMQAEVFDAYARCDFGLLLREPSVVNRVACPTKLIEYLRFGVIPVLLTPEVGDFAALGMRYVTAEAFRAGDLPDPEERRAMAAANRTVYAALLDLSREGQRLIAEVACAPRRMATPLKPRLRSTS